MNLVISLVSFEKWQEKEENICHGRRAAEYNMITTNKFHERLSAGMCTYTHFQACVAVAL